MEVMESPVSGDPAPVAMRNAPAAKVVEVIGMHKWFGKLHVLNDVNLTVERGEVICVIGPSGTGKSTMLRTINHLIPIDEGKILVNGSPVGYRESGGRLVPRREGGIARGRRDIGMVFQDFNLFWHMTLLDNVMLGPRTVLSLGKQEAEDRARMLLERVGLKDKMSAYPRSLSGGQQQRGAIARALAMQPKLMLFDEPTSALDPDMTMEVVRVVEALADEGMTMIIVSHEMSFVRNVASRIVMMSDGTITEDIRDLKSLDLSASSRIGSYLQSAI